MKKNLYNPLQPLPVPPIQAVVFDLDGVFIDTEWIAFKAFQDVIAQHGSVLSREHFGPIIGLDMVTTARYIIDATRLPIDEQTLIREQWEAMSAEMKADLPLLPGAADLVSWLRSRRLPIAIASNSPVQYIEWVLSLVGLSGCFQAIAGIDRVANGKPAPDVYLAAASALGVEPARCLAIEDSPVGLQAALNAGMVTAVVPQAHAAPQNGAFDRATIRVPSLVELHHWLENGLPAN